jgi:hypothetical protein
MQTYLFNVSEFVNTYRAPHVNIKGSFTMFMSLTVILIQLHADKKNLITLSRSNLVPKKTSLSTNFSSTASLTFCISSKRPASLMYYTEIKRTQKCTPKSFSILHNHPLQGPDWAARILFSSTPGKRTCPPKSPGTAASPSQTPRNAYVQSGCIQQQIHET